MINKSNLGTALVAQVKKDLLSVFNSRLLYVLLVSPFIFILIYYFIPNSVIGPVYVKNYDYNIIKNGYLPVFNLIYYSIIFYVYPSTIVSSDIENRNLDLFIIHKIKLTPYIIGKISTTVIVIYSQLLIIGFYGEFFSYLSGYIPGSFVLIDPFILSFIFLFLMLPILLLSIFLSCLSPNRIFSIIGTIFVMVIASVYFSSVVSTPSIKINLLYSIFFTLSPSSYPSFVTNIMGSNYNFSYYFLTSNSIVTGNFLEPFILIETLLSLSIAIVIFIRLKWVSTLNVRNRTMIYIENSQENEISHDKVV